MNIHFFRTLVPTAALLLAAGSAPALSPSLPYRVRLPDLPAGQPARLLFTLRVPEGAATNAVWSGLATVVPASDGTIGVLLDNTLRADPAGPTLEDAFRRADGAPLLLAVADPETALPHGPEQTVAPGPPAVQCLADRPCSDVRRLLLQLRGRDCREGEVKGWGARAPS